MRKLVLVLLPLVVVAFFVGVAGAAAAPYYGAVMELARNATAALPLLHPARAGGHVRSRPHPRGAASDHRDKPSPTAAAHPAPTATPVRPRPTAHPKPSQSQLALAVQHLAKSSKLPRHRINILVLGSDNDTKFAAGTMPPTQVMIVLSIDPGSRAVTLLSIPRDSWVKIPGYRYNTGPDGTLGWSKIDVSTRLGFDAAACTVEHNYGIPIDHWVWVGLKGFMRVVNTMHGVTIDVTHPVIDDLYPDDLADPNNPFAYRRIYIPPGPQHLNGDAALHFVRSRHGDIQGDFGRSQRQQIVLTQLRRVLLSQGGADLIGLVPSLLRDFQDEIKTDLSPDLPTAATYWGLLRTLAHARINQVVLGPPYVTPEYYVTDSDPQVTADNAGVPVQEDAVLPNWPLINQKIVQLFGAQYWSQPHCALVPGASSS